MRRRRIEERVFKGLMLASLGLILASLGGIVLVVVLRGVGSLSLEMILDTPSSGYYLGGGGGIANAIVGSLCLAAGGLLLSSLIGLPIAFALQREFLSARLIRATRLTMDTLWGVPSIVVGAIGFIIMQALGINASLLGGIIALTLLMLPIMTRAIEEVIKLIPPELKEVAYAMGATRVETTLAVVARQAVPGVFTGLMLALGRGIGDAASILFTAGYTDRMPRSLLDPAASLPLAVFFQIGTPYPEVQGRAYSAALILLLIVLAANLAGRLLKIRFTRHIIR